MVPSSSWGPSWGLRVGMRVIPGASLLGDHARALGIVHGVGNSHGKHQRCLPAWGPPWGLMVHPWALGTKVPPSLATILGSEGSSWFPGTIWDASLLGDHIRISGTIPESPGPWALGDHPRCFPAWEQSRSLGDHSRSWGLSQVLEDHLGCPPVWGPFRGLGDCPRV